jgi:hypothetical protein
MVDMGTNHPHHWQKTPCANLIRYDATQSDSARIKTKGKLIRRKRHSFDDTEL